MSEGLAINDTPLRRFLTLAALKSTARFYRYDGYCIPISSNIIVKKGKHVHLTEAATMAFVSAHTNIPVPRVHCSFVRKGQTYIVMERVRGVTMAEALRTLTEPEREQVMLQLRGMLQELRALPPPSSAIGSCVGGSLRDCRIPRQTPRFGPFPTTRAFHHWLREGLQPEEHPDRKNDEDWIEIKRMVAMHDQDWGMPVFTHSDLNPFNIMVRDGKIAAIIDWEFSGWLPHYWEFTTVWLGNTTRIAWQNLVAKFIDPCPDELYMEKIRSRWWGEF